MLYDLMLIAVVIVDTTSVVFHNSITGFGEYVNDHEVFGIFILVVNDPIAFYFSTACRPLFLFLFFLMDK